MLIYVPGTGTFSYLHSGEKDVSTVPVIIHERLHVDAGRVMATTLLTR